ncbi:MAG TPA: hypothetical protein VF710_06910 [Longimicrobium sp.]
MSDRDTSRELQLLQIRGVIILDFAGDQTGFVLVRQEEIHTGAARLAAAGPGFQLVDGVVAHPDQVTAVAPVLLQVLDHLDDRRDRALLARLRHGEHLFDEDRVPGLQVLRKPGLVNAHV